jgi:cytidyltransferase-like protein
MKYSLFIGRYQPLHQGHIKLIEKVLSEGKNVCVALRDTDIDKDNPYSAEERINMFTRAFGERVKVIVIPDIEEVCYGRKVGWGVREIRLDDKTESISATEIRNSKKCC